MKSYFDDWNNIKEFPNIESYTDSILFKNFLMNKQDAKKELKLSKEITKKKYQISHMFNIKFGKNFLNQKPESLKIFEKRLAKYLFDPDSKFLAKFPKLQRKLRHEKKISEEILKSRIDIGSMVFFDLRGKNRRKTRNINNGKEKILTISKNFTSSPIKDIVGNTYYKTKFWDKNSKRLKSYFKNKLAKYRNNYIEEENENDEKHFNIDNEENNSIKALVIKDYNTQREKSNLKLNTISNINNSGSNNSHVNTNIKSNTLSNNSNINSINKHNIYLKNNMGMDKNKSVVFNYLDKMDPSSLDIKINESISFGLKDSKRKRSSINKYSENNTDNDKYITSYNMDFRKLDDLIPKLAIYNNLSRNQNNNSNYFTKSNTNTATNRNNIYNISNIKANNKNLLFTITNFNKKKNINKNILKNFKEFKINSSHKYSPRYYLQKSEDALKKKNIKYKNNLNNQIIKLNKYTNKCNTELIKLIDGNNDDNYKERKKEIINKTKLDIKEILVGKTNNSSKNKNEIPQIKNKAKEKDTIRNLIKIAIYDMGDNFGKLEPKKKEKVLKKKIHYISDEQALEMIEDMIEKEKELNIKDIIGNDQKTQIRKENNMKLIRKKAESNYEKMLKLKSMILIDKGKVLKPNIQNLDI